MGSMKDLIGDTPFQPTKALARTTDLATSHEAAARVTPKVNALEAAVADDIAKRGDSGATWDEIASHTGIDKSSISPRFKPLRAKKKISAKLDNAGAVVKRGGQTVWVAV